MRIDVNQPESKNVEAVFLNGKRLVMCVEADDKEGWVKIALPPQELAPNDISENKNVVFAGDPIQESEWQKKTLYGDVEIVLKNLEGLDDSGLSS